MLQSSAFYEAWELEYKRGKISKCVTEKEIEGTIKKQSSSNHFVVFICILSL
jgi:hypothetical protein